MVRAGAKTSAEPLTSVLVLTGAHPVLPAIARRLKRAGLHVHTTGRQQRALNGSHAMLVGDRRVAHLPGAKSCGSGIWMVAPATASALALTIRALIRKSIERERVAEQQRALLDAVEDGIIWLDRQARIRYANAAAANLLGCADARDLRKQPISSFMQLPARAAARGIADLPPGARGEQVCWREDGSCFPVEYQTGPLIEHGRVRGAVLTFRDITDRRASDRLKDELVGIVSHELRSPLTSMRSALGLLASGRLTDLPSGAQRMLDIAVTNTDRLIRLINDLLDFERLQKGQMPMTVERCNAAALMAQAVDVLRPLAKQADVELDVSPAEVWLEADPDRLLQVLINLLTNAIKFSSAGGSVWLDAERVGAEVTFRVRDQGRGIPSDKLETIFNRFSQVEAADGRDNKGTGLGLAISRGIVQQHGGQIWAESTAGVGTTFFVALPCEAAGLTALHIDTSAKAA